MAPLYDEEKEKSSAFLVTSYMFRQHSVIFRVFAGSSPRSNGASCSGGHEFPFRLLRSLRRNVYTQLWIDDGTFLGRYFSFLTRARARASGFIDTGSHLLKSCFLLHLHHVLLGSCHLG